MKNKILMVGITLLSMLMCIGNAQAACASYAYVDGESICVIDGSSSSNKAGTVYNASSSENIKIVLNNYNGGSIEFKNGLGSNPANGVTIELIGDNYITNETGYGILSYITGLNFVGDGTLNIK